MFLKSAVVIQGYLVFFLSDIPIFQAFFRISGICFWHTILDTGFIVDVTAIHPMVAMTISNKCILSFLGQKYRTNKETIVILLDELFQMLQGSEMEHKNLPYNHSSRSENKV
jgi:hypothetical protein